MSCVCILYAHVMYLRIILYAPPLAEVLKKLNIT